MITPALLGAVMPLAGLRAQKFAPIMAEHLPLWEIDSPLRVAAFLSQVAVETGELRWLRELGGPSYWAKYDTGRLAKILGNTPEADGDGQRYPGRGLFHLTGTDNHRRCGEALGLDLLAHPELLEQPLHAVRSACWYWKSRRINEPADAGDITGVTRRVNPGLMHLDQRKTYYGRALQQLGAFGNDRRRV